jgi:hypothetical protein
MRFFPALSSWNTIPIKLSLPIALKRSLSSNVQSTFSFFASQTLHNIKNLKKKSGEAKDSAIFPLLILLHKRAKPFTPPLRPTTSLQGIWSPPQGSGCRKKNCAEMMKADNNWVMCGVEKKGSSSSNHCCVLHRRICFWISQPAPKKE